MILKRVNRSDPEQIYIVGYNSSADAWANGYAVRMDYTTDVDGVGMEKPAAGGAGGLGYASVVGVAVETIAAGSYGLIQIYGYHSAVRMRAMTGATTQIAAGSAIACDAYAAYCLGPVVRTGTKANAYAKGISFEAQASHTTATKKAFLMCM